MLNVRGASLKAVSQNQEIVSLCSIIGLNFNKTYETAKEREELRFVIELDLYHLVKATQQPQGSSR